MRMWGTEASATVPADGVAAEPTTLRAELREAYRRGRRDERLHHRRSPLITVGLFAVAAIGAIVVFYAAREGSFARGGQVVDNTLTHATGQVVPNVVNSAAARTGDAMQSAGERLKNQGAALASQPANAPASSAPTSN